MLALYQINFKPIKTASIRDTAAFWHAGNEEVDQMPTSRHSECDSNTICGGPTFQASSAGIAPGRGVAPDDGNHQSDRGRCPDLLACRHNFSDGCWTWFRILSV